MRLPESLEVQVKARLVHYVVYLGQYDRTKTASDFRFPVNTRDPALVTLPEGADSFYFFSVMEAEVPLINDNNDLILMRSDVVDLSGIYYVQSRGCQFFTPAMMRDLTDDRYIQIFGEKYPEHPGLMRTSFGQWYELKADDQILP
jgi:hypothetical protein